MKYPLKKFLGKSWLWYLNFFILQWLFIRLGIILNNDNTTISKFSIIKYPYPLTGWWSNYKWIGGCQS